jgi:hypothetical protein
MPNINKKLNKSFRVVPLTSIDNRLDSESDLKPIKSRLKVSKVRGGIHETMEKPMTGAEAHKPMTGPDVDGIASKMDTDMSMPDTPDESMPDTPDMSNDDIGLDDELPMDGDGDGDGGANSDEHGGATPSDGSYSTEQAYQQLNGILNNWMDLSGKYPEGEERHKFLEIGERLREIAGVIKRDYIDSEDEKAEKANDDIGEDDVDIGSPEMDEEPITDEPEMEPEMEPEGELGRGSEEDLDLNA